MTLTLIGWIILPLSLWMILFKPEQIYALTIIFLPFSATAILNFGAGDSASGLQVWLYLAILLLARKFVDSLLKLKIAMPRDIRPLLYLLGTFVLVCGISLIMPIWIDGHLAIVSPLLLDFSTTPLSFSSKNLTGFLYVLLGFAFAVLVAEKNRDAQAFRSSAKLYLISCSFVASWGLFQLILNIFNLPYPAALFNSSNTPAASGYLETLDVVKIARVTSVAVEPSMLVQTLLVGLVFTIPSIFGTGHVWSRRLDYLAAILLAVVCFAATSSVGYVGLALLFVLICWSLLRAKRLRTGFVLFSTSILMALVGAYFTIGLFRGIADSALFNKGESYSALERAKTIFYAFQYFLAYPFLGVGWASVTSHDVVAKLLSNVGIVGFAAFAAFIGAMFVSLYRSTISARVLLDKRYFDQPSVILIIASIEMLVLASISEFPAVFGHFWFILGMAIAATSKTVRQSYLFARWVD